MTDTTVEKVQEEKHEAEENKESKTERADLDSMASWISDSKHIDAIRLLFLKKDNLADGLAKIIKAQEDQTWQDLELLKKAIWLSAEYVFTRIIQILKDDKNV